MTRALFSFWGVVAMLGLLSGCGHYQLGSKSARDFHSIHVTVATTALPLPQSRALVTTELRNALSRDGRLTLADAPADADVVLKINLQNYRRNAVVGLATDTGLARRFDVVLTATATLTDQRSGKTIFADRQFTATRGVFTDSGQNQAEYETLPLLAADLAEKARQAILDTW